MTHKKIAEIARVSASTVSKALAGSTEVRPELAERIRKIAIESGYFSEKVKRKREYSENKALLLALIVPEIFGGHYSNIVHCLKDEIESRGGNIAIYIDDFNPQKRSQLIEAAIVSGNTDGIIVFSNPNFTEPPAIPTICIADQNSVFCDTVGININKLMNDVVDYLKKLGHTKIGFVGELHTTSKAKAFKNAMSSAELMVDEDLIYTINDRFENIGIEAANRILTSKNHPTAIIAAYDEVAYGLINKFTENGLSIPNDISIVGINNISSANFIKIPLTTVNIFSEEQYKTAIKLLFDKIFYNSQAIQHITIQHEIIERQSTKKINSR